MRDSVCTEVTLPRAFDLRRANCCSWQSGVDRSSKGREADRLQSLLPRLQTRYEQVANKEEYATWINQYDPLKSRRDALDTEIKNVYAAAVAKLVPLLHQLAPLNNDISQWCRSKPSGHLHDGDKRWLSAIPTPHDLKLPNPDKPTVNLWPPAPHNYGTDNLTPILGSPGNEWWKTQQAEGARARIEDAKRADALQEEEGRVRNDPKLWRRG